MKEISRESLIKIHDVIHGQNYVNIKARLDQLLPDEYSKAFAGIKLVGNEGVWYGEKKNNYQSFATATDADKDEIASWLKTCKEYVCEALFEKMPWVQSLFIIPTQNEIYWYRNSVGELQVTLAQWGFESKLVGHKVDIIGLLISQPQIKSQQEVVIHIDYSDGGIAADVPFVLNALSNPREANTNDVGDYRLGRLFPGKKFSVETLDGCNRAEFTVEPGSEYKAVFDWATRYKLVVENQKGERKAGYELTVDGASITTDTEGCYEQKVVLRRDMKIDVVAGDKSQQFDLHREADDNLFRIIINEEEPPIPPLPPVPPMPPTPPVQQKEYIMVKLLDYDGTPMPNLSFVIRTKKESVIEARTDEKGEAKIDKTLFDARKKYHIETRLTTQYREELNKQKTDKQQ